ncbi:MAG: class I SAM-dependent methyltransferase [Terriglobia bacterium]
MTLELRRHILSSIKPIYRSLRTQKLKLLFQLLGAGEPGSLLDVGGGQGLLGEFLPLYRKFKRVTLVNLDVPNVNCEGHDGIRRVIGDGCSLPFGDRAFDWVFSNAVIEHVGDGKKQEQFADEIRRVASKGYFVATPNKWFPIDPHTLLPLYQFISPRFQRMVVAYSPGLMREYEEINLLSRYQLQSLFPESVVVETGLPVLPNSIIAYWRREQDLRFGFLPRGLETGPIGAHFHEATAFGT